MVKAKKHLGQHFLRDEEIASSIVGLLKCEGYTKVLEIGPGTGVLTKYLLERDNLETHVVELDRESVGFLKENYPSLKDRIHAEDFLHMDFSKIGTPMGIIGNFPYNISSQILFKVLEHRNEVPEVVGMFQREVAARVASAPGNKTYGILSVLLQAYYDITYEITVPPTVFEPPPKVESGVIRLSRNTREELPCDPSFFKAVVKTAFNQRRKTLRNSLKGMMDGRELPANLASKRPEQLDVEQFIELTAAVADQ
jgi:16S rRNA (adenine1518-N6/adenine1519-N6)-dimethyltransferase